MEIIENAEKITNMIQEFELENVIELKSHKYMISHLWARNISSLLKEEIFEIFKENMQDMYQRTSWGWDESELWNEFFSNKSGYLLIYDQEMNKLHAYIHFQFTWDDEDVPEYPVLYCYQLQVRSTSMRKGLGKLLMSYLLRIARECHITVVMLTCFKENLPALEFYSQLGFRIDENSPSMLGIEVDYEILSIDIDR